MGFIKDFKAFLLKKDIVDVAIAFIIAVALKAVINALVDHIIMPIASVFTGGKDFTQLFFALNGEHYASLKAAKEAGAAVMTYGSFIQAVINFIVIGLVLFMLVKMYEKAKKKKEEAPAGPTKEEVLLTEIRDELRKKKD